MADFWRLGLLGYPLSHSISPQLHGLFLQQAGLEGEYSCYATPAESLAVQLETLLAQGVQGLNVTVPHKVAILPLLNALGETATLLGAVNTITTNAQGHTTGHNTDAEGFWASLPARLQQQVPNGSVLVLGGGGAARAVLAALVRANAPSITLALRNPDQKIALQSAVHRYNDYYQTTSELHVIPWRADAPDRASLSCLKRFHLVVNTTPIGMYPQVDHSPLSEAALRTLPEDAAVVDLVYNPLETLLLHQARALSLVTVGGLGMLVHQGAAAFQHWTGHRPTPETCQWAMQQLYSLLVQTGLPKPG
ncbi:MAG: shikimate dehydrogenase [Candidatus Melainabacteria bacterium]|nr:shikimate dehydrogenase [Candidatus Melainabacteria bacterium]